jgi:hypothetical protein
MGQIEVRITPLPPDPNLPFPIRFPVSPSLLGHLLRYSQVPPEFLQGTPPLTASVSTPYFLTSFHTFVSANSCIQTEGGSQTPSVLSTTDRFLSPVLRSFATTLLGAPATTGSCFQLLPSRSFTPVPFEQGLFLAICFDSWSFLRFWSSLERPAISCLVHFSGSFCGLVRSLPVISRRSTIHEQEDKPSVIF